MIDNNTPIAITLTAQQWEMVMRMLAEGPYKIVAPLIADIQQQCIRQEQPIHRTNGETHDAEQY